MAGIFKNIQGLYGLTTKKVAEEILAGASTTDSEATPSQNIMVVPLQEIRAEGVGASQPLEQEQTRLASPQGLILRSASPPPQKKKTSSSVSGSSEGDEKSTESTTLVKRKRAPAQSLVAAGDDDEIVYLTVGREHEIAADDTTSTKRAPQP
ncbi:hypothetical protein Dimus_037773, partial [Dionaea muscipula]